jgi:cyclase
MLLDIRGARERRVAPLPQLRHLAEECFIPLSYGGGVQTVGEVEDILFNGYEKIVFNTALAESPEVVHEAASRFGSQAIVGSIDVRGAGPAARAVVRGGSHDTGRTCVEWARRAEELGVGELLLTSIDREGTMSGFDLELVRAVTEAVSVPVIAHGGAGKRAHLTAPIAEAGASAVAAGSLFVFQGRHRGVLINYPSRGQITKLLAAGTSSR